MNIFIIITRTSNLILAGSSAGLTCNIQYITIGYMKRDNIVEGVYLKQTKERYGIPAGLIGVVHQVSRDWTGEGVLLLRYLDHPEGTHKRPASQWSLNLREKDLADFELIGTWITAQALPANSPGKPKKATFLCRKYPRISAWMRPQDRHQLKLFREL